MRNFGKYLLLGTLAFVASCETTQPAAPPPPPVVKAVNPPLIPQNIAPSEYTRSMQRLAGIFKAMSDETTRAANPSNLTTVDAVSNSLDRASLFTRSETIDGAKAYAVLAATQSTEFLTGISKLSPSITRANFIQNLQTNPNWVTTIDGFAAARVLASQAIGSQLSNIENNAAFLKAKNYEMQKLPIAKIAVPKDARLKTIDANWAKPVEADLLSPSQIQVSGNASETVDNRILAAAALYAIRADKDAVDMLRLGTGASCAMDSKIDYKMCVSATKYSYEHAYCMYEYYKEKFGQCVRDNVNDPAEIRRIKQEASAAIAREHAENSAKLAAQKAAAAAKKSAKKPVAKKK